MIFVKFYVCIFQGNQSRKFLKSVPMLETLLMSEGPQEISKGVPYIMMLSLFDKVVETCFCMTLKPEYEDAILAFKKAYMELGVSITPTVFKNIVAYLLLLL